MRCLLCILLLCLQFEQIGFSYFPSPQFEWAGSLAYRYIAVFLLHSLGESICYVVIDFFRHLLIALLFASLCLLIAITIRGDCYSVYILNRVYLIGWRQLSRHNGLSVYPFWAV